MFGRDDFFIHGQGIHGSDGCIVSTDGHAQQVFALVLRHRGGFLQVETSERHGVDYDAHWAGTGMA